MKRALWGLLLLAGCAGPIENAQSALNATAVVVNAADDLVTDRYTRALTSLGGVTAYEKAGAVLNVVRALVFSCDVALDFWREGGGPFEFYLTLQDLISALEKLDESLREVGVTVPGLHTALELLRSILNDTP